MNAIDFTRPWRYSDVQFRLEGKHDGLRECIYASKVILSMWSTVWEEMFNTDNITSARVLLKGFGREMTEFIELMRVLHPPSTLEAINDSNVRTILPLAREFKISGIMSRCREVLQRQTAREDIFYLSVTYEFTELEERSFNAFVKSLSINETNNNVRFQALPPDRKQRFYEAKVASAEDEAKQAKQDVKLIRIVEKKSRNMAPLVDWDNILSNEDSHSNIVRENCERAMLLESPSMHNLVTADKHQLSKVIRHCQTYINSHTMTEIKANSLYVQISNPTLVQLLMKKTEYLEHVLTAVVASDHIPPFVSNESLLSSSVYSHNYRHYCTNKMEDNSTETDLKLYSKIVPKKRNKKKNITKETDESLKPLDTLG